MNYTNNILFKKKKYRQLKEDNVSGSSLSSKYQLLISQGLILSPFKLANVLKEP